MRIVVITDSHANLPALQAALNDIRKTGYDLLVHTGDAIAIGPYPAECLDLLLSTPNVRFVMGNHESYYVEGLPQPQLPYMSDREVQHQLWTHSQLAPESRKLMARWPYRLDIEDSGTKATFVHYPLDVSGRDFQRIRLINPTIPELDAAFDSVGSSVIFSGHEHSAFDVQGRKRYVNPGALGCSPDPIARYCSLEISGEGFTVQHLSAEYDRTALFQAFEARKVPDRELIQRAFFGRDM